MPSSGHKPTLELDDSAAITKVCKLCALMIAIESDSPPSRWLYRVFLALDANFRLKRKNVSSEEDDPALGDGWAYFVKECTYKEYLSKWVGEVQEVREQDGPIIYTG